MAQVLKAGQFPAGENIIAEIQGDKLVITIDLKGDHRASSTGKSVLVATTGGQIPVNHPKLRGLKVAVNVTVPATAVAA